MTHFVKATDDSLSIFLRENYSQLRKEFFEEWLPFIDNRKLMFTWHNGKVPYKNIIFSAALKLSDRLLDSKEREGVSKIVKIEPHMYPVRDVKPDVWNNIPTWRLLVEKFDNAIEALTVNIAYPGAEIFPHYGVDNHCLRQHLCLQNNLGFTFDIGGEKKKWLEGPDGMFRFDDGNILHGVKWDGGEDITPRIVIIFDIWKDYYV